MRGFVSVVLAFLLLAGAALAGEADVRGAVATLQRDGTFKFSVTIHHADADWKHYADKWEIVGPDGKVLGTRVLAHPHVRRNTFTRILKKVVIPPDVDRVTIRAHDKIHGFGGKELVVKILR